MFLPRCLRLCTSRRPHGRRGGQPAGGACGLPRHRRIRWVAGWLEGGWMDGCMDGCGPCTRGLRRRRCRCCCRQLPLRPARAPASLFPPHAVKAARFVRFCDAFNIPLWVPQLVGLLGVVVGAAALCGTAAPAGSRSSSYSARPLVLFPRSPATQPHLCGRARLPARHGTRVRGNHSVRRHPQQYRAVPLLST